MATRTCLERRLAKYEFSAAHFDRARRFYDERGFRLAYSGIGRFRGVFHVSHMRPSRSRPGASWVCIRDPDPTELLDAPSQTMRTLLDMHD